MHAYPPALDAFRDLASLTRRAIVRCAATRLNRRGSESEQVTSHAEAVTRIRRQTSSLPTPF